ncbi:MAG: hypothetical protein HC802_16930, partial [Caldilineaceae bacterium]|nr:hypothetical protein [Caldilineaceae bacterium]
MGTTIFGFRMPKMPRPMQSALSWLGLGDEQDAIEGGATIQSGAMVDAGQRVVLTWDTVWATNLIIEKELPGSTVFIASIENPFQQREYSFIADQRERAVYVLRASNAIDRIPIIGDSLGRADSRLGLIVDPV